MSIVAKVGAPSKLAAVPRAVPVYALRISSIMKLLAPLAEAVVTAVVTKVSCAVKLVQVAAVSVHRDFPH